MFLLKTHYLFNYFIIIQGSYSPSKENGHESMFPSLEVGLVVCFILYLILSNSGKE